MKRIVHGPVLCALACGIAAAGNAQAVAPNPAPEACKTIRGRAVEYRGDAFFEIWHVGTHHIFFPADAKSSELVCQYFDCSSGDRQPALFADFTICPTEPYIKGAAQPAIVKRIEHPVVITDWPPASSAREYAQAFYTWYASNVSKDDYSSCAWTETRKLSRWDLSPELAELLKADTDAKLHCRELVGIDFDPFLLTQDPAEKYEVGAVKRSGGHYFAQIHRVENGKRKEAPDVIAEITRAANGQWSFVNFRSTRIKGSLLSILKASEPVCSEKQ